MKRKIILSGIIVLFFLISLIPSAYSNDIWGVSKGDTRVYYFTEQYSGNITGTTVFPTIQYQVLNKADFNGNNRTDLYYRVNSLTGSSLEDQFYTVNDNAGLFTLAALFGWEYQYFTMFDSDDLEAILIGYALTGNFLLPLDGDYTNFLDLWGINWTRAYGQIQGLPEYSCNYEGNLLVINCTKTDELDAGIGLLYNLTKTIVWDSTKGFLVSVEISKSYQWGLYNTREQITSQNTYNPSGTTFAIGIYDIFWIIALVTGALAAIFSIFVYYRIKKRYS